MLLSQAHRDEQVCVEVDVVVSVDGDGDGDVAVGGSDHRHNRVSIPTIRSKRSSPRCFVVASTAFSTNNASSTAAHSIADPASDGVGMCGICLPGTASRFSNVEGDRTCCAAQLIKQRGVPAWNLLDSSSGQSKELDRTADHVERLKAEHGDSGSSCI